jgi:hypothetical protein
VLKAQIGGSIIGEDLERIEVDNISARCNVGHLAVMFIAIFEISANIIANRHLVNNLI